MRNSLARHVSGILIVQLLLATSPLLAQQQSSEENRPRRVLPGWNSAPTSTTTEITRPTIPAIGPEQNMLVALETSRVRVEPRLLSPLPANLDQEAFQLAVGAAATREEAEQISREVKKLTGEDTQVTLDTESKSWGLLVGGRHSREVVASAANSRLFSSSAPVSFASDNEASNPVRYNDRAYRGRIEVFTNLHGSLTVVNELGL